MPQTLISSLFAEVPLAVSRPHAMPLLNLPMPELAMTDAPVAAGGIERYQIQRGIAVLSLRGLITPNSDLLERYLGWTTCHGLEVAAAELAASEQVSAVVLACDTPGGLVISLEGAALAIAQLAAVKPVHALVHPLAASAGYWIASQATDIALTPGSRVGSIGIARLASAPVQPGSSGEQAFSLVSSHARAKRPDPTTDDGLAEMQRDLDAIEAEFHATVARGRGVSVDDLKVQAAIGDDPANGGAVFWGQDAVDRGLVDHLETTGEFWARMAASYAPRPTTKRGSRGALALAAAAQAQAAS